MPYARSRYPADWESYPRDRRLGYMVQSYTREGLIRLALTLSGYELTNSYDSRSRLSKQELAAIVLALDPDTDDP